MKLRQKDVDRFVILCAALDALAAEREAIRLKFIQLFRKGAVCPDGGPRLLELIIARQPQYDWEAEWIKLAKRVYGKNWKAEMTLICENAVRVPVPQIRRKPNPTWTAKRGVKRTLEVRVAA